MALPEEDIGRLLRGSGLRLAVAESCTGGLISHRITNVPGSSDYFLAGFVPYGNSAKATVLGVGQDLIERHGAVSAEVVEAMARGARRVAGADVAAAVSGIAGPGGGSPGKPVGLVFLAVDGPHGMKVARRLFNGSRTRIKEQAADTALGMLREELDGRAAE